MGSIDRPDTYYGYKQVKARLEEDNPDLYNLVMLLEQEYKHREIKTCAKPAYVLSRMVDLMVTTYRTEEKKDDWSLKKAMWSFIGNVKSQMKKPIQRDVETESEDDDLRNDDQE